VRTSAQRQPQPTAAHETNSSTHVGRMPGGAHARTRATRARPLFLPICRVGPTYFLQGTL
jgi:hypothetical protein